MATAAEQIEGERWTREGGRIPYRVTGTDSRDTARSAVESDADDETEYDGITMVRGDVEVEAQYVINGDASACIWEAEVTYKPESQQPATNSSVYRFDISAETQTIKEPEYRRGIYAPDEENTSELEDVMIENGDGVDISQSKFAWTETHYLPEAYITWGYFKKTYGIRGTVNDAPFRAFNTGEVLLEDMTGAYRPDEGDWEMQFRFIASPNRTNLAVGPYSGIVKAGHDYLWVQGEEEEKGTDLQSTIKRVFVDQVYEYSDFSELGIGTGTEKNPTP